MTHDLEGDLRDALLPLRDWETATGGAPDDLIAAILAVIRPAERERDTDKGLLAGLQKEMRAAITAQGQAERERDEARAALDRVRELPDAWEKHHRESWPEDRWNRGHAAAHSDLARVLREALGGPS